MPEQLVVELHYYRGNVVPGVALISPAAPRAPAQMALLMSHMAALGYGVAARDDNTKTADTACCTEVTFVRAATAAAGAGRRRHKRWAAAGEGGGSGGGGGKGGSLATEGGD